MNYFKIFDIEEEIEIDLDLLEEKYHAFQRNFHPDKAGIEEIEKSISFNAGYDILNDEFLRIAHLLKINGVDIENDSKAPKVDVIVLQEIMEIQEKISAADVTEAVKIKEDLSTKIKKSLTETKDFFAKSNFEDASQSLMKVKYLKKALREVKKV